MHGTRLNDLELLYRLRKKYGLGSMSVRKHPSDPVGATYPWYGAAMDPPGGNILDFILDCETTASLISGAGMEAMLLGRKAVTLLPCPSYYASGHDLEDGGKCAGEDYLSFFCFGYLIPFELLLDVDYFRWRLSMPSEREIYLKHLSYYFEKKRLPEELIPGKPGSRLERMLSAQGYQLGG
jgi:hypothetical protein